jgi:hypothetical protein
MNYTFRHLKSGKIITRNCYRKLPNRSKDLFTESYDKPTHEIVLDEDVSSGFSFIETAIAAEVMTDAISDIMDTSSNDSSNFDFGGGDFGGAGAGDSW